jgi:hypothetical protein
LNTKNWLIRKLKFAAGNWAHIGKKLLYTYDCSYIWESPQNVDINCFITCFKQRLIDTFLQDSNSSLANDSVLFVFKNVKQDFEYEDYLSVVRSKNCWQV